MNAIILVIILLFIGGIILLSNDTPHKEKSRDQFLKELTEFLEGKLLPFEDEYYQNSFQIQFKFSNEDFVYEDLEKQGFKSKIYIAYLKVKTPSNLTLTFTEKKRSTRIRTDIFIASEVSTQQIDKQIPLNLPKFLNNLKVFTNDTSRANMLLEDNKVAGIFKKVKNTDSRGYPFLSIGIVNGEIILEIHSEKRFHPNIPSIRSNVVSIEDLLEDLLVVVRRLKKIA